MIQINNLFGFADTNSPHKNSLTAQSHFPLTFFLLQVKSERKKGLKPFFVCANSQVKLDNQIKRIIKEN